MDEIFVETAFRAVIGGDFEQFDGWLGVEIRIGARGRWHAEEIAILEKLFGQQGLLVEQVEDAVGIDGSVAIVGGLRVEQSHAEREGREGKMKGRRHHH